MNTVRVVLMLLVFSVALALIACLGCSKKSESELPATEPRGGGTELFARPEQPSEEEPPAEAEEAEAADADAPESEGEPIAAEETGKVITTDSGLKYIDHEVGEGPTPETGQTVVVHYTGRLADGTKFDSSVDRGPPFEFQIGMGQVIVGWDEGIATMKAGGKRKLIIPSELGYEETGTPGGPIPPNAELHFEVELLEIK